MAETNNALAEHPNVVAVRGLIAAFSTQDRGAIEEILDERCVWRVPGNNALAGEYKGRPAVMGLFGTLKRVLSVPARFEIIDVAASDRRAVAYQFGVAVVGGRTLRMRECLVFRFENGRVVEVDEFQADQAAFDEVFSSDAVTRAAKV